MVKKGKESNHCPYIECAGAEPGEPLPRPSYRHRCAAVGNSQLVAPRTQIAFCLVEQYSECPFFAAEAWKRMRPPEEQSPTIPDWLPS